MARGTLGSVGVLVTVALALHFAYLAYVVVGGFLAWRWPKAIWVHLIGCAWAVLIVLGLVDCPLTWLEDWARERAGQERPTAGFVDRYLDDVIYPERYVNVIRVAIAVIVAGSWIGAPLTWRRRRRARVRSQDTQAELDHEVEAPIPRRS